MRRSFQPIKFRLGIAKILFLIFFIIVGLRAFHLQVLQGEKLRRLGERQHLKEWIVLPKRGSILDRSGEPLALSLESQSVYARPRRIHEPESAGKSLARILNLNTAEVRQKLVSERPFVWIKRQISPREAEEIQALNLEGVGMYYEPNRYYPHGQLAGQVIGFVGRDSQALEGIELQYDQYIRGETGSSVIERDALGRRVLVQGVEELQIPPGGDIHLTLDMAIQHLAEKELGATIAKYRAKAGVAIVIEPFTGEVLALANYPEFNPNNFTRHSSHQWRNRAVTDAFEPGSTFKTILAAAALEEGVVGKEDLFYCEMGKYSFAGRVIHDTHEYGWLPFYKILQYSSNIGATKVAEKLNKERYFRYIKKFGFGRPTGIDMPGEVAGMVRSPEKWAAIDVATHAFGQGISATPMQMAMAYAAVANGGFLMKPYIVRRVVSPKGEILAANQPHVVRRVVSERTARLVTSMLKGVVSEGGTGVMANVEGFEVAGKTGTAQKADLEHGGYAARKRVASFIGFVPADDPRLVLMVLVDEPQANVYGGVVAAPVFGNIARGALRHLGVVPERPEMIPQSVVRSVVPLRKAPRKGNDTAMPGDLVQAPDFVGLSLREAVEKARTLKVKVKMHGHGYVVEQAPTPGSRWQANEVLVLKLQG